MKGREPCRGPSSKAPVPGGGTRPGGREGGGMQSPLQQARLAPGPPDLCL
ncbi:unnamed protein product [Gulo gulo]|uniref:Uncharacterized protein n=1 Tax=Gulo gulo TaxID=48420 RepID=A0A9X9MAX1_GULGU|nr:unnamed protein product [Gulo gulo]